MAAYHRLNKQFLLDNLDYKLPAGIHIIPPEAFCSIEEATRLVNDAQEKAQAIIKDAKIVREQERQRGYQEGLAQGKLRAVEETLQQAAELDARLYMMEQSLTEIVLISLRKLVDGLNVDDQAMAVVRGALKQMRRERKAELRVSSSQIEYFRNSLASFQVDFPSFDFIDIIEDISLLPGQVVVETSIGRVEGDLGSYYNQIAEIIRNIAADAFSMDEIDPISEDEETHYLKKER